MRYALYLDDLRNPSKESFDFIARSCSEAKKIVEEHGFPSYISFDHDLGDDVDGTGYDFAKWLIGTAVDLGVELPKEFDFNVHSANPVGEANINHYFACYFKHLRDNK